MVSVRPCGLALKWGINLWQFMTCFPVKDKCMCHNDENSEKGLTYGKKADRLKASMSFMQIGYIVESQGDVCMDICNITQSRV